MAADRTSPRLRDYARRALAATGVRRSTAPRPVVDVVRLPHPIDPGTVPAYVLIEDTLHDAPGRVRFDVPVAAVELRRRFLDESDPVAWLATPDGRVYSGLAVSRRTGCLELAGLPSAAWLQTFYASTWGNRQGDADVRALAADVRRARAADKVFGYVRTMFAAPGRVLDVGCGYGDQLAIFAANGWQVDGIEPSEMRRRVAREAHGLALRAGGVESLDGDALGLPPESFDLIVLNQVIEHLPDPAATLTAVRRHLKPGGLLFVAVPDLEMETAYNLLTNFIHVRSYTRDALGAELAAAGFAVAADVGAPGYNIVTARMSAAADPSAAAARAASQARAHVAAAFPGDSGHESLLVVSSRLTGTRTVIYHRRGVALPETLRGALAIVTPALAGSFKPA